MDNYLEELCKHNQDPETKFFQSMDEIIMMGKKPKAFEGTPEEFYKSFFTPEMTPNMGIVHGDHYQLYFKNRTVYPVIPTDVSQIDFAKKQILKNYPKQIYGVEDVDIEYDEIEEIPVEKFSVETLLNPKDHCFEAYGSKPGDTFFIQGDQNKKWVTGKKNLLNIGDPMPSYEKEGTEGDCSFITPKNYCTTDFYHQAMKLAYNENRFVKQVICEADKDKFIHILKTTVDSSQKNDLIILNDFQEVLERMPFSDLGPLLHNTSGEGKVLFSDKDARMFKSYWEIFHLQEFAVTKSFVEKFQKAFRELNNCY